MPGEFQVEILATRESKRVALDIETDEPYAVHEQYIPPRYNSETELSVVVKESGPFDFDLEVK